MNWTSLRPYLALPALMLVACAACDRDSESPTSGDPTGGATGGGGLAGRTFVFESVEGYTLPAGGSVRASFGSGELQLSGGCNSIGAPYEVDGGQLMVDEQQMSTTERGCEPPLHEHDDWLARFFGADPALSLADARLTLTGGDVTLVLLDEEVAVPDRPLVGTAWELNTIIVGDSAGFGAWPATVLRFADDGTFAIAAGCPVVAGTYTVRGDALTFAGAQPDVSACPAEPADWVTAAADVLRDGPTTFAIDGTRLSLTRGTTGLDFQAQP